MFFSLVSLLAAGPWVREPGHSYLKGSMGTFWGEEAEGLRYSDLQAGLYGELGLPARLGLTAWFPWLLAWNEDTQGRYVALSGGDAELVLQGQLLRGPLVLALDLRGKFPLYTDRSTERLRRYPAYATRFPVPGDGQVDLELLLEGGTGWRMGEVSGWLQGSIGGRYRFAGFSPGIPMSLSLGWSPKGGWLGLEGSALWTPTDDGLSRSWFRIGAFGAWKIGKGLALEAWLGWIFWARYTRTGGGGGLGLSWEPPAI